MLQHIDPMLTPDFTHLILDLRVGQTTSELIFFGKFSRDHDFGSPGGGGGGWG